MYEYKISKNVFHNKDSNHRESMKIERQSKETVSMNENSSQIELRIYAID